MLMCVRILEAVVFNAGVDLCIFSPGFCKWRLKFMNRNLWQLVQDEKRVIFLLFFCGLDDGIMVGGWNNAMDACMHRLLYLMRR